MRTHLLTWLGLAAVLGATTVAGAAESGAAADIARRSFGAAQARSIALRSVTGEEVPAAASTRIRVPASALRPVRSVSPSTSLDAARLERTDRYRALIEHHSRLQRVDADLVQAIVYTESGGVATAESPAGALGLMQLMPATAQDLGVADPLDPEESLASGIRHLRNLLDRYGSTELALWAYNAGPGAVRRGVLPAETEAYVPRVLGVRRALVERQRLAHSGEARR